MKKYKAKSCITVKTGEHTQYDIILRDSFSDLTGFLEKTGCQGRRVCIVTDTNVASLYLDEVKACVSACCDTVEVFQFEAGEKQKTLNTVQSLYEVLIQAGFDRKDTLLALGGGVVGDLTGFAAATYLRGIRYIQIPTTLLAQIDSSVGGKTAVDFDQYKNMVGAFHQPALVYINYAVLKTLPGEQFCNGTGEVLKYGIGFDDEFYEWCIENMMELNDREEDVLALMVSKCCDIKAYIVEKDPNETKGDRTLLNLGHTIGHAIEKLMDFKMPHGECVTLGTVAAAYISWKRGLIEEDEFYEIRDMNVFFGLPISFDTISAEDIVETTKKDKKMDGGTIRFVLLKKLGRACTVNDVTDEEMLEAVRFMKAD